MWVASNDRNRTYKGKKLGDDCLDELPNLGLNEEASAHIGRIDVLWLRQTAPVCAFEVETTTSIYSGLLRMSDLLALVPALKLKLYIVAPQERQHKYIREISRPTFQKIGLTDYCKFISIEHLEALIEKVRGFRGHVQPSIVDTVAIEWEQDEISSLS